MDDYEVCESQIEITSTADVLDPDIYVIQCDLERGHAGDHRSNRNRAVLSIVWA